MVEQRTLDLEQIFDKLLAIIPPNDENFEKLKSAIVEQGYDERETLTIALMSLIDEDYSDPKGMESLILAIVKNESLWSYIEPESVFNRAVFLYESTKSKMKDALKQSEKKAFDKTIEKLKISNAIEMVQVTEFTALMKKYIFKALEDFKPGDQTSD